MPAEKINFYKIQQQHDMCSFIITIRVDYINTFCDYQSIETKHRQLSEVSQRRTASRLLFNNMQIYSVNDLLRPLHVNVLYHRVRSGR
ncbi:hypothetical protein BJ885_1638 [Enterobacter sp. WP_7_1]|nr:hypothetical protein BJ885_1638 [Enterobacter sp. WP_7_1]RMA99646.1 hypothetical protein BJ886_1735 [Enterobacter sp. WP_7_2]